MPPPPGTSKIGPVGSDARYARSFAPGAGQSKRLPPTFTTIIRRYPTRFERTPRFFALFCRSIRNNVPRHDAAPGRQRNRHGAHRNRKFRIPPLPRGIGSGFRPSRSLTISVNLPIVPGAKVVQTIVNSPVFGVPENDASIQPAAAVVILRELLAVGILQPQIGVHVVGPLQVDVKLVNTRKRRRFPYRAFGNFAVAEQDISVVIQLVEPRGERHAGANAQPWPNEPVATSTNGSRGVGWPSRSQPNCRSFNNSLVGNKPVSAQAA